MIPLLVLLGGAVGAPLRYLLDSWATRRWGRRLPWGIALCNLLGCLALGVLRGSAAELDSATMALAATGLCGALTTYSAFGADTVRLLEERRTAAAAVYALGSVLVGVSAVLAGELAVGLLR